jgi:glycosyltransferase involved in cell wall biosynthesis
VTGFAGTVLKIWDSEYPWDVRVEKVSKALTESGYRVHLAARNRRCDRDIEELPEATVHRMPCWKALPAAVRNASMFPVPVNPRWLAFLRGLARRTAPDVVLCRDLPLAVPAWIVARRAGVPIVLDMAEHYPAMLRSRWTAGRTGPWDYLVRNPAIAASVERWIVPRVDHVITVVEESRGRFISLGAGPDKVSVVSNTPPRARVAGRRPSAVPPIHVVYLGLIEEQRGIGTLVEAAGMLRDRQIPFRLTVIGDGKEYEEYRRLAARRSLDSGIVDFRGRMDNPTAQELLRDAHVGVIPHFADESWNFTIPNKLFDYMAAGLAVVTSDAEPAARVVRDTEAGKVFRSEDATDLADALASLVTTPKEIDRCGGNGQQAVFNRYNWERDREELVRVITGLVRRRETRRSDVA